MNFDQAFERLILHEGGYVSHPADPGGETYKGVSRRAHPSWAGWSIIDSHKRSSDFPACLDKDLNLQSMLRAFYLHEYWGPAGCDALPGGVRFDVFDMAVNSGVRAAVKLLQRVVGETEDGVVGPRTIQAASSIPAPRLVARFNGHRLEMMAGLPTWPAFGRGWARRIASNLKGA